jgi:hypothetical protein
MQRHYNRNIERLVKTGDGIFRVGAIYARFIQLEFILNECGGVMVKRPYHRKRPPSAPQASRRAAL